MPGFFNGIGELKDRLLPGPTPDMTLQLRSALKTGNDLFREGMVVKYSLMTTQIRK